MRLLWSELPGERAREVAFDAATIIWIGFWVGLAWRLYDALGRAARAVGLIRDGGQALVAAGDRIGDALARLPVVGASAEAVARTAFHATGSPFVEVGGVLERLFIITFALLALLIGLLPIAAWLHHYVPWRAQRIRDLGAAERVIRVTPGVSDREVERLLASRALHRLSYDTLLHYSPDPFGDWANGRFDRLARAELASAGLRLRRRAEPVQAFERARGNTG